MGSNNDWKDIAPTIIGALARLIGQVFNIGVGVLFPIGSIAMLAMLFYKRFGGDIFAISEEKLENMLIHAQLELKESEERLKKHREVIERVRKGEIRGDEKLLEIKEKQLEEQIRAARTNVRLLNAVLMFRRNVELFERLYGGYKLKEVLRDPRKIEEKVNKVLKDHGLDKIDIEAITEYLEKTLPIYMDNIKREEASIKAEVEPIQQGIPQPSRPQSQEVIEASLDLLNYGEPQEWAKLIEDAVREGKAIKLPLVHNIGEREGFKNLLIALYSMDAKPSELKRAIRDRSLTRYLDLIVSLKKGGKLELDTTDSRLADADELLEILCGKPVETRLSEGENEKVQEKLYVFKDIKGNEIKVSRRVIIDKFSNIAKKVEISLAAN